MSAPWWEVLGIPRDSDRAAKRRAYAALLKVTHPEDDPAGFMALREAYEAALSWIEYEDDWYEPDADANDPGEAQAAVPAQSVPPPPADVVSLATPDAPPDSMAAARAADQAALRELTAAFEAALRGPWFKPAAEAAALLDRILTAPAMIELATRDRVELWLADLLADTVPRSDPLLDHAIAAFDWEREGDWPPGVWRVRGRIDEWRLIAALDRGNHELAAGWRALTGEHRADWHRRLAALRPGLSGQVQRLLDLADYQMPGLAYSMAASAVAWWRQHLARPRFGFLDLAIVAIGVAIAAIIARTAAQPVLRTGGATLALVLAIAFPIVRLRHVAPWRALREADYAPPSLASHGWAGLWALALLTLIWTPAGPWMAGVTVALSVFAALWMAAAIGREPALGNPTWQIVSFAALAWVGGPAFASLPGAAQAALAAFAVASLGIALAGRQGIADLLWQAGEKPVLAAALAAGLLILAATVRMSLPAPPPPLLPFGAAAIAGMVLTIAVRDVHDRSFVVRFMPALRFLLWIVLVGAAILSTPDRAGAPPPVAITADDPIERIQPQFAIVKAGNPDLYAAVERARRAGAGEGADWDRARREIDRLVNAEYRKRLPTAPTALIAAEMDIRLAMLREQQQRDAGSCASTEPSPAFTPSDALRKRHHRHALRVAASAAQPPAAPKGGRAISIGELYRLAAKGDAQRAARLAAAMAGPDAIAKCAARIAVLEALVAQPDADIAETMRPALIERAAIGSTKS